MQPPETRYTKSGDAHIAYQVVGDGPIDLLFVNEWLNHIDEQWGSRGSRRSSTGSRDKSSSRIGLTGLSGSRMASDLGLYNDPVRRRARLARGRNRPVWDA
jgi:hypothetical protein